MVAASLSIFHGLVVESSFSVMNDVMDSKSNRMNVAICSAIQTVNYSLRARNVSCIEFLKREDIHFSPVNQKLCLALRSAGAQYSSQKKQVANEKKKRREQFKIKDSKPLSKEQARIAQEKKSHADHAAHQLRE